MIKKIVSNELVRGSFVLFIAFNIFNILNFVFQFSMARMLGPVEYGVFAVLMSMLYFMAIPSDSIQSIVSRYTSKFNVNGENGKIKSLITKSLKKGILFAFLIYLLLMPFFYLFSYFLNISFFLVLLTGLMLFTFFLIPTTRGVLQGQKRFNSLGINMVLDSGIKVLISLYLVFIGWSVYGAVLSILLGSFIALILSFIPLRKTLSEKSKSANFSGIYQYSSPIVFSILAILLMQSLDVILAKRFFSPEVAGQYAVANLIGKMIFFGTLAISKSMFPLSSEKFDDGKNTNKIFYRSLIIVLFLCVSALLVLLLFPELFVKVLFGEKYLPVSNIIFNIGLAFSFISLSNLVVLYCISVNRKINTFYMAGFVIIQVILLWFFKSSLYSFSIAMMISSLLLFIGSLIIIKKGK